MRAIAKTISGIAPLILSTGAFAQDWVPTKPVWDQADRVTCRETHRYTCIPAGQCSINTGRANFKFDFSRNELVFADGAARYAIEGRVFKTYPSVAPNSPAMSLLLGDGRLFKFVYKAKGPKGPYDLEARMLGHDSIGPEVEVFEFTCSRS